MSDARKEKSDRPFYELPAHIKPCSRIIQETRLQLSYGGKYPHAIGGLSSAGNSSGGHGDSPLSSAVGPKRLRSPVSPGSGDGSSYFDTIGQPGPSVPGGIRAVYTQRPKTGIIDNDLLWGVSSRKRPPSAITLSRLSLDESEEDSSRPGSSSSTLSRAANSALGAPLKPRQKHDLRSTSAYKSLPTPEYSTVQEQQKGVDDVTTKLKFLSAKSESSGGLRIYRSLTTEGNESDDDEGLLGAINHLSSLVNPTSAEPPMKSEVICALQRVKGHMSEVEEQSELKHRLLRLIFKLVERNQHDEDLIFWASFVLLHCKIMGNNLTTVFKMVFKASRSKDYWPIIQDTEYLDVFMDSFGQICPLTQTESMIYGYGTLKFICMEKKVLLRIVELNLVPIMTLHLKLLNYELTLGNGSNKKGPKKVPEAIFNGVFQLTSILRSVVGEESTLHQVVTSGLLDQLCNSLSWTVDDVDILSNVVRILSVVSGDSLCCQLISSNESFSSCVVKMIQMWHSKEDVIVRLTYCLGNLLAQCESMRLKLFQEPNCYSMILHLINFYLDRPPLNEDILIKSIRILANWSLNPNIGREFSEDSEISHILNTVLKNQEFSDELLICVISTLNNITFYKDYNSTDVNTVQTAEYLCDYLTWKNTEGRTEVMKVLGNLTRNPVVREAAAEHVDKLLLSLHEQDSEELLCATVGVLMNIIVDSRASQEFLSQHGLDLLLKLLETKNDIALNLMICQFLWNVLISWENRDDEEEDEDDDDEPGTTNKNNGDSSSELTTEAIIEKQRTEIRCLIKRKLDSIEQLTNSASTEYPYVDLESELRSVAQRLFDKLQMNK